MGTSQIPPDQMEEVRRAVEAGVEIRAREIRGESVPPELREQVDPVDERLFKPVRELFGGRVREATTGAAPIAAEILEFFYAAGVPVMEGYGMTESTGLGLSNRPEQFRFRTVGRPLEGVEVTIAEDGEILMRGDHVFSGYWRNEEATKEVLDDEGWLHTGDLGEIDDDGFVSITGRKKDIIITAGGKNLAPANVENDLKQSRFISQAVMYGDRRPYPVALITLDEEEIVPWAREHDLPETVVGAGGERRGPRPRPGRPRRRQRQVRPGRTGQALHHPRTRPRRRSRGAHADAQGQAQRRVRELRRRLRRALREEVVSAGAWDQRHRVPALLAARLTWTRSRPASFASYMAMSASRSTCWESRPAPWPK